MHACRSKVGERRLDRRRALPVRLDEPQDRADVEKLATEARPTVGTELVDRLVTDAHLVGTMAEDTLKKRTGWTQVYRDHMCSTLRTVEKLLLDAAQALRVLGRRDREASTRPHPGTTLTPREWQMALRWRERFLLGEAVDFVELEPQVVAYLVADCEEFRKLAEPQQKWRCATCPQVYTGAEPPRHRFEHTHEWIKETPPDELCPDCGERLALHALGKVCTVAYLGKEEQK